MRATTHPTAALDQAMAIQHRMDGAFGGNFDSGKPADQALPDLARAPTGMLALHVQDVVLHLKGKLVGVSIGTTAPVGQPLNPTLLIAIENFVAGLARRSVTYVSGRSIFCTLKIGSKGFLYAGVRFTSSVAQFKSTI